MLVAFVLIWHVEGQGASEHVLVKWTNRSHLTPPRDEGTLTVPFSESTHSKWKWIMFGSSFFCVAQYDRSIRGNTTAQSLSTVEEDVAAEFDSMPVTDLERAQWRQQFRA